VAVIVVAVELNGAGSVNASGMHEYTASLRVISDGVRLAELSAVLGELTSGHDIGDRVGRGDAVRAHAFWGWEAGVERTRPLEEHVEPLVTFAEANRGALEQLRARGCRVDVFCGVFAEPMGDGGWVFEAELSRRLGDLNLPVSFDLH
jgi:Domain of unknown function (DUF4279)